MKPGVAITVVDPDDDYLGIEVTASNGRFCGSVRKIYAGPNDLGTLADLLEGFPASTVDTRSAQLGHEDRRFAGGFVRLSFRTTDSLGSSLLEIELLDDDEDGSMTRFVIPVEAAGMDSFVSGLRAVQSSRSGCAHLPTSS